MSPAEFDLILEQALQLRAAGVGLEACLERFPRHAAALRPLLETADRAAAGLDADAPVPTPDLARGRARLLAAARAGRPAVSTPLWRWAVASLIAIGLILATGAASSLALPGDLLYPVKRAIEDLHYTLTRDPEARDSLRAEVNARRQGEVTALSAQGREASLTFEGVVEEAARSELVVNGIRIEGDHSAEVGETVRVRVRVTGAGVILEDLTRIAPPSVSPEPTALPTTRAVEATPTRPAEDTRPAASATAPATRPPDASPLAATQRPSLTPSEQPSAISPDQPTTPPERPTRATEPATTTPERPTPDPRPTDPPSPTPERRRP